MKVKVNKIGKAGSPIEGENANWHSQSYQFDKNIEPRSGG